MRIADEDDPYELVLPEKLIELFDGEADYRVIRGGRGSGKTRGCGYMIAVRALMFAMAGVNGLAVCGREFQNSLSESSMAEVKAAIADDPWLRENFVVGESYIHTAPFLAGRVDFEFIGLRRSLASVKSKARILILWVDEAEPVTETAWLIVEPTIREEGSELWVSYNPEREESPTNKRFWLNPPPRCRRVEMNWRDNPFFPEKLERMRQSYKERHPEQYDWVWEGSYRTYYEGAYYADDLLLAREEGRIGIVPMDRSLSIYTFHDLAGRGRKADAYSIWVVQFVGQQIRVLAYYEVQGQASGMHINWLRDWCRRRKVRSCRICLPHDGDQTKIDNTWADIWSAASNDEVAFDVEVIPGQGPGAAMIRVEALRGVFPRIWFNEATTEPGRKALQAYHEHRREEDNVGLGPKHDWASHGADALGLMACTYEPPAPGKFNVQMPNLGVA